MRWRGGNLKDGKLEWKIIKGKGKKREKENQEMKEAYERSGKKAKPKRENDRGKRRPRIKKI